MALKFFPKAGQIFICDFTAFKAPEMTKKRPVVVISPKLPYRSQIATVVPVSLTEPEHDLPFVVRLSKNYHPTEDDALPCWAKCDMVMNLSIDRLYPFKVGRRKYTYPQLTDSDLKKVQTGVIYGLGLHLLLE